MPVRDKSLKPFYKNQITGGKITMKVLIFFIAFILGGMAGIVTMCLAQINRESEAQLEKISQQENKNKEEEKCRETS